MPIRITGMNSGLDTESIIAELVKAKSASKDKLVKSQTKLQWKQDAWKELNSKIYSFYSKTLSNMRLKSDYYKKTTKVSDDKAATVITGGSAVNGVQTLKIDSLAKSGYLTGAAITTKDGGDVDSSTTLEAMEINGSGSITMTVNGETKTIDYTKDTTLGEIASKLKNAGVNASFDDKNNRFFISAKSSGASADFTLDADKDVLMGLGLYTGKDEVNDRIEQEIEDYKNTIAGIEALVQEIENLENQGTGSLETVKEKEKELANLKEKAAGQEKYLSKGTNGDILVSDEFKNSVEKAVAQEGKFATRIDGEDAKIYLNGAEFTSDSNTFEINGLTITANQVTDKEITLTTADDTEGIYNMIKDFLKEYNELINEMDKLYNADSSKGYEPLTDEEKEAMSEKEIEKWEEKIKNSILRRDSTLSSVATAIKQVMAQGFNMLDSNGKSYLDKNGNPYGKLYLNEFGIGTLGYFTSKDNEKNAYHIDGDPDDASTNTNADKLKTAIANDPEKVVNFFSGLAMNLYNKIGDLMKKTEYSSSFTVYDDVAMKNEYNDFTSKIKTQEQRIKDFEDRYYKKFSAMETAMAKMQSKQNAISGLIGM